MRKVSATINLSLDGVMQAPGRPDEDTRGGFQRGGWALPEPLPWKNSTLLQGDATKAAATLWFSVRAAACSRTAAPRQNSGSPAA